MTIYETVAYRNPEGAKRVVNSYGSKAIRNPHALAKQLNDIVNAHGEEAQWRIAAIHPDYKLITDLNKMGEEEKATEEKGEEKTSCDCKEDKGNFFSAEGQAIKDAVEDIKNNQDKVNGNNNNNNNSNSDKTELLIVGGIALIALALVLKK